MVNDQNVEILTTFFESQSEAPFERCRKTRQLRRTVASRGVAPLDGGSPGGGSRDHRHTLSTDVVVPMETLVVSLKHALNEVVVDKTGLTGMYTFNLVIPAK
jgi:uncharacterized protein (TIGR03435 family)